MADRVIMRKAVIDVGTNSVKYILADGYENGSYDVITDVSVVTKLGEGLNSDGLLKPEAIERTALAVADYVRSAKREFAFQIEIIGTMALRSAANSKVFTKRVRQPCGVGAHVVSGETEAQLSFSAVAGELHSIADDQFLMFDMGGGSTEFVYSEFRKINKCFSLNVGAIRLTEQYFRKSPMSSDELESALLSVRNELRNGGVTMKPRAVAGTGGNITAMASVALAERGIDAYKNIETLSGYPLAREEIKRQLSLYSSKTPEERKAIPGLPSDRSDIIIAGAAIADSVLELTRKDTVIIATRGLRFGMLEHMFKL